MTIRTKPATQAYRAGWEGTFGAESPRFRQMADMQRQMGVRDCEVCGRPAAVRLLDSEHRLVGRECCWNGEGR